MWRNLHVVHELVPDFLCGPNVAVVLPRTRENGLDAGGDIVRVELEL